MGKRVLCKCKRKEVGVARQGRTKEVEQKPRFFPLFVREMSKKGFGTGWIVWDGMGGAVALINKIASIEGFFLPFLYAKESQDGSKKIF